MLLWTWKRLLFVCSTEDTGLTKPVCWLGRFTGETCFLPLCVCVSQYVCVWFYVHSEHTALLFKDTQLSITGWITLSCTLNTLVHLSNRKGFIGGCPWWYTQSCLLLMSRQCVTRILQTLIKFYTDPRDQQLDLPLISCWLCHHGRALIIL